MLAFAYRCGQSTISTILKETSSVIVKELTARCLQPPTSNQEWMDIASRFWFRYTWSVLLDQVEPAFPYISDTGTLPPASCLFSQLLNIITVFMSCCVYIRYRLVKNAESGIIPWVNTMAAWLGGICCLGLSLVANFQESNVSSVHVLGADTCFIGGAIYFCLQVGFYTLRKAQKIRCIIVMF
uniref:CWH43-like N-terminal domain-containing protein n=1 Tax=Timema bartmani TaxID=61472 RepID=A0A7R9EP86_9NEOP|nr:unnamed protein product [Timema bartmani]